MFKKTIFTGSCLVILLFWAGCQDIKPALSPQNPTMFTPASYPRVDGSTANIPLGVLMAQKLAGFSEEAADALSSFSTTPYAYSRLLYNQADLLLVYEGSEVTKEEIASSGIKLEFYPIGLDALVFIVNENNPVDNLRTKDIQDIYQGIVTNWAQVGGLDEPIIAFQRNEASGSQALMRKLVMQRLAMTEAPTELSPTEMGALIEQLADYNNAGNALGYSVYYYAQNMYAQPGLKFLAVDGIIPGNDTISDKSYPFINEFYAVIRADKLPDSATRKMLAWILSPEGEKTIEEAGYVPVKYTK